ncbi:MAG: phosphotransferase family protein [Pseudomonadota bacterium]
MDSQRTRLNTGTSAVRPGFELDVDSLHSWLSATVKAYAGPLHIEQFKGGQSNPTYKLNTPAGSYVLRRKPPGVLLKSAHAIDREYRVMTALVPTAVPVPDTFAYCRDESVIGTAFFVMEYKAGRIFWDLLAEQSSADARSAMWYSAVDAMAALHTLEPSTVGLEGFGRGGNYIERQFARWTGQYEKNRSAVHNPAMGRLIDWLPRHMPDREQQALIHGDYQFSNMVYHAIEPKVVAVLDWELSTIGNPLTDLAYFCRVYHLPAAHGGLLGMDFRSHGIPLEQDLIARYSELTGTYVDNWPFYVIFAMFRLAAIRQGVAQRVVQGSAASAHARQVGDSAVPIAEAAWHLASGSG